MRDFLNFSAERRGNHLVAVVAGHDASENPVEFVMSPDALLVNLLAQARWVGRLEALEDVMQLINKVSGDANLGWAVVEPLMPDAMSSTTGGWASAAEADAQRGNDGLEGLDNLGR